MEGAAVWIAFYRANPHRFAKDYLHLNLHLFQKILIIMMNWSSTTVFIGSRGIGKSFLSAVFCVIRCILYLTGSAVCLIISGIINMRKAAALKHHIQTASSGNAKEAA